MKTPVIDLHCDLLYYLAQHNERTPYDRIARCSLPQLFEGNIKLQVLPIFTETKNLSITSGLKQLEIFRQLPLLYPKDFAHFLEWNTHNDAVPIMVAIENASSFCDEDESLTEGIKRLHSMQGVSKPLYISLTWNTENRFGGGALTDIGLKGDGKHLLDELDHKQIAIDLSHASDALAYDIIDYIEGHHLTIPLVASHSNSRKVTHCPRNLPDAIAREVIHRKGLIGLNLYRKFIGQSKEVIVQHLRHWLDLKGESALAFGADFFYEKDLLSIIPNSKEYYFNEFQDAACYGTLLEFIQIELNLDCSVLEKFAHQNALTFIKKMLSIPLSHQTEIP